MRLLPVRRRRDTAVPARNVRARTRGQAMVEFAILLPLFALFLVIAIDFGRVFFSYIQITNAAREAASYGASRTTGPTDNAGMLAAAEDEANVQSQGGENAISLDVVCRNPAGTVIACSASTGGAGAGNTLTATVSERFSFITPLVNDFLGTFTMRTSATATVLGFAASSGGTPPSGTCTPPVASFTVNIVSGLSIDVDPTASSPQATGNPCNISGYFWYWGDGDDEVGNATASSHTYTAAGTYTIRLEVTNQAGLTSTTRQVTVPEVAPPTCAAPHAGFTVTRSGQGNKTHTYHDTSTVTDAVNCPITNWLWTFNGLPGAPQSNAPNPPPQTYANNSNHTTTLTVTNAGGSNTFSFNH